MDTWIEKIKLTKERHQQQNCKVFELKFDKSALSKEKLHYLNLLFLEAKWLYNHILASNNIFQFDTKINLVNVLDKDKNVSQKSLNCLSSQMKQSVQQRLCYSIKSLSSNKKKRKIGKLKFRSQINSIVLNQHNITYRFFNYGKYLKLQGFKKLFKINGFRQIPKDTEITVSPIIGLFTNLVGHNSILVLYVPSVKIYSHLKFLSFMSNIL